MKRKPDNSCVFCDHTIQPHLLLQHMKEKHMEQARHSENLNVINVLKKCCFSPIKEIQ